MAPTEDQAAPAEDAEAPVEDKSADEQNASAEAAAEATAESDEDVTPEATLPVEGGAPVLDSAKEAPAAEDGSQTAEQPADGEAAPAETQSRPPASNVVLGPRHVREQLTRGQASEE